MDSQWNFIDQNLSKKRLFGWVGRMTHSTINKQKMTNKKNLQLYCTTYTHIVHWATNNRHHSDHTDRRSRPRHMSF